MTVDRRSFLFYAVIWVLIELLSFVPSRYLALLLQTCDCDAADRQRRRVL